MTCRVFMNCCGNLVRRFGQLIENINYITNVESINLILDTTLWVFELWIASLPPMGVANVQLSFVTNQKGHEQPTGPKRKRKKVAFITVDGNTRAATPHDASGLVK
ncbi:7554_t:CDS:2 [Funneliformis mosseae]|uniref:7554_t:CDS:1 n=1 Tax=Funneliformis mosseae TaxID=27381 RepID=A0A9N8ZTD7_FUNMO|nr:7554_t:CDS:2 [Funneliformis mosseae]